MSDRSCARWDAGIPPSGARLPVDPTSPMCAPRDDNHNTPEPPPSEKEAGLRLQPIRTHEPRVSNLWGGQGRAGGGRGWSGRGCVRGRRARVESREAGSPSGHGRPAREARSLHPAASGSSCPVPPLPRARPGRTCVHRGGAAQGVRAPRVKGAARNDNNSTQR